MSNDDHPAVADWDAATYDRMADPQTRWGSAVLDRLELNGNETVLDCGCGTGRATEQLARRLPAGRVVALDASPAMLAEARHRMAWAWDRVSYVTADLVTLTPSQLDVATVDAVFSTATFHLIADHDQLFHNIAAVLRPGGQLVAQCGGEGNISALLSITRRLGVENQGVRNFATVDATRQRLEDSGFVDLEVWTNDEPTRFDSPDNLLTFLEAVCLREPVAAMGDEERERFLREVVDAMPDRLIDYVRLNITARRSPTP